MNLPQRKLKRGLTILEVMLALAIAGLSLASIAELVSIGVRAAERARDISTAQFLAEGKLNEFAAGVGGGQPVSQQRFLEAPDWVYSVGLQPLNDSGLVAVTVVVERADSAEAVNTFRFQVVRWIPDQTLQLNQPTDDPYADATAASSDTSSSSSSGSAASGAASSSSSSGSAASGAASSSGLGGSLPSNVGGSLPSNVGGSLPSGISVPSGAIPNR